MLVENLCPNGFASLEKSNRVRVSASCPGQPLPGGVKRLPDGSMSRSATTMNGGHECFWKKEVLIAAVPVLLVVSSGCGGRVPKRLLGYWEGRPQPAVVGGVQQGDATSFAVERRDTAGLEATVLERFNFRINLDFPDENQVLMVYDDGHRSESKKGRWRVVSYQPKSLIIEIELLPGVASETTAPSLRAEDCAKQFRVRFDRNHPDRFQLLELGSGSKNGAILFERRLPG